MHPVSYVYARDWGRSQAVKSQWLFECMEFYFAGPVHLDALVLICCEYMIIKDAQSRKNRPGP